jgi:hypothetical protein
MGGRQRERSASPIEIIDNLEKVLYLSADVQVMEHLATIVAMVAPQT